MKFTPGSLLLFQQWTFTNEVKSCWWTIECEQHGSSIWLCLKLNLVTWLTCLVSTCFFLFFCFFLQLGISSVWLCTGCVCHTVILSLTVIFVNLPTQKRHKICQKQSKMTVPGRNSRSLVKLDLTSDYGSYGFYFFLTLADVWCENAWPQGH